jgi:hypothetical protein
MKINSSRYVISTGPRNSARGRNAIQWSAERLSTCHLKLLPSSPTIKKLISGHLVSCSMYRIWKTRIGIFPWRDAISGFNTEGEDQCDLMQLPQDGSRLTPWSSDLDPLVIVPYHGVATNHFSDLQIEMGTAHAQGIRCVQYTTTALDHYSKLRDMSSNTTSTASRYQCNDKVVAVVEKKQ